MGCGTWWGEKRLCTHVVVRMLSLLPLRRERTQALLRNTVDEYMEIGGVSRAGTSTHTKLLNVGRFFKALVCYPWGGSKGMTQAFSPVVMYTVCNAFKCNA